MVTLKRLLKYINEYDLVLIQIEQDKYLKLKEVEGYNPMKYGKEMSYCGMLYFTFTFESNYFVDRGLRPKEKIIKQYEYNKEVLDAYLLMNRLNNH